MMFKNKTKKTPQDPRSVNSMNVFSECSLKLCSATLNICMGCTMCDEWERGAVVWFWLHSCSVATGCVEEQVDRLSILICNILWNGTD